MSDLGSSKRELRQQLKQKRQELCHRFGPTIHHQICRVLADLVSSLQPDLVFGYAAIGSEVSLASLYRQYQWAFPKVDPACRAMAFYRTAEPHAMQKGYGGICEPLGLPSLLVEPGPRTLILVPGLGFDRSGHRLGYGGGYYDRYLAEHRHGVKIGVIYHDLIVDHLPHHGFDQKVDGLVSESGRLVL